MSYRRINRISPIGAAAAVALALSGCGTDHGDGHGHGAEPPPLGDAVIASVAGGSFVGLGDYAGISGRALIVRGLDESTTVSLVIEGLAPNTLHPAHVHALPCGVNAAGGHYKVDPSILDALEDNEIWPEVMSDDAGVALATITVPYIARPDAQSIVVHDPNAGGAKMACVDLSFESETAVVRGGTIAPFAAAEDIDLGIAGAAEMTTTDLGVTLTLSVQGLNPAESYVSHVHAFPCAVTDAGGHYKRDTAIEETLEENELWPVIAPDANGDSVTELTSDHIARPDAQSVVIHREIIDGAPKVACVDLARSTPFRERTFKAESAIVFDGAREQGLGEIAPTATLVRRLDGITEGHLLLSGFAADAEYGAHVHVGTCAVASASDHYKIDPAVAETIVDNELHLSAVTDAQGAGHTPNYMEHLARPEAASIIIHDAAGVRLACLDLE